ncbi:3-keto-5-aminohexanoate cleavage protein [Celeribacter sp.]|uniref:3-keto-5-aminohexanoate cleavage protein n=1 Tax=Celeribacter sp. TaxID=1890673 RepID=UPI003A92FD23
MNALADIMVAPNGARLQKSDHPNVPVTTEEIVACALACAAEGAGAIHIHVRDEEGRHVLDSGRYREVLAELERQVPQMTAQITTEAVGRFTPQEQAAVAFDTDARYISAAPREITSDDIGFAKRFYAECAERGITIQHILYSRDDAESLTRILTKEALTSPDLQLLFVLGRYSEDRNSKPDDLRPFLDWLQESPFSPDWACCAFGQGETDCLTEAVRAGGKCRIGFENSTVDAEGRIAPDNTARVRALVAHLIRAGLR